MEKGYLASLVVGLHLDPDKPESIVEVSVLEMSLTRSFSSHLFPLAFGCRAIPTTLTTSMQRTGARSVGAACMRSEVTIELTQALLSTFRPPSLTSQVTTSPSIAPRSLTDPTSSFLSHRRPLRPQRQLGHSTFANACSYYAGFEEDRTSEHGGDLESEVDTRLTSSSLSAHRPS